MTTSRHRLSGSGRNQSKLSSEKLFSSVLELVAQLFKWSSYSPLFLNWFVIISWPEIIELKSLPFSSPKRILNLTKEKPKEAFVFHANCPFCVLSILYPL